MSVALVGGFALHSGDDAQSRCRISSLCLAAAGLASSAPLTCRLRERRTLLPGSGDRTHAARLDCRRVAANPRAPSRCAPASRSGSIRAGRPIGAIPATPAFRRRSILPAQRTSNRRPRCGRRRSDLPMAPAATRSATTAISCLPLQVVPMTQRNHHRCM